MAAQTVARVKNQPDQSDCVSRLIGHVDATAAHFSDVQFLLITIDAIYYISTEWSVSVQTYSVSVHTYSVSV